MNTSTQPRTSHTSSSSSITTHVGSSHPNGSQIPMPGQYQYPSGDGGTSMPTRGEPNLISRYLDQQKRMLAPYPPPPSPPLAPQRGQTRQDPYPSMNGTQPPRRFNIPSSVRAVLYDKAQAASHYPPPPPAPPQGPSYSQPSGQHQPQGHSHPAQLNYRYDNGPKAPSQVQPLPPPPPSHSRQHQEYVQHVQQPQHHQHQHQQRSQLPPTPPPHNPPMRVHSTDNHSSTLQRTNGYPSPVEQQHPPRRAELVAPPSQAHSYIHPPAPLPTQGPSHAPMHRRTSPPGPVPPPPPPVSASQPITSGKPSRPRSNSQPEISQQATSAPSAAPPPPRSASSGMPISDKEGPGSNTAGRPIEEMPPPPPRPTTTIDPFVLVSANAALDPIQRGLEALWGDTVANVRGAMSKMHEDYTVLANQERRKSAEVLGRVGELEKMLSTRMEELDKTRRELGKVRTRCEEAERRVEELGREMEGLVGENEEVRRESRALKGALREASRFVFAFRDEYEKAKAAGDKADSGSGSRHTGEGHSRLVNRGFEGSVGEQTNIVGNVNKALTGMVTKVRDEGDATSILGYMTSMLGAVGDEVSRQMELKMSAIMDEMEEEKTRRIKVQEQMEQVLRRALPYLDGRNSHPASLPQSRVASPEPMASTSAAHLFNGPSPMTSSLQQRSVSSDSGVQKRGEYTISHPLSRSFSASEAAPTPSRSARPGPAAKSSSPSVLPPPPPPPPPSSVGRSNGRAIRTETSQEQTTSDSRMMRDAPRGTKSTSESPLPTPPPSRADANTHANPNPVGNRDQDKDKDGDQMMVWRVIDTGPANVNQMQNKESSNSDASRLQTRQQKEMAPTPVAFRGSSGLVNGPTKAAPALTPAPPPPVNVKRMSSSGDMSMSSSRCASVASLDAQLASASDSQSTSTPPQWRVLTKRSRAEYERDDGVGESESARGGTQAVRMKLDPEVEEEENRKSLSSSSSVARASSGGGGGGGGMPLRVPTELLRRASAATIAGSASSSLSIDTQSSSSSRSKDEGELTPRAMAMTQAQAEKRGRPGKDEYEEAEVVERTPAATSAPRPPVRGVQENGVRARVRIRPEILSRASSPPPSKAQAQLQPQPQCQPQDRPQEKQPQPVARRESQDNSQQNEQQQQQQQPQTMARRQSQSHYRERQEHPQPQTGDRRLSQSHYREQQQEQQPQAAVVQPQSHYRERPEPQQQQQPVAQPRSRQPRPQQPQPQQPQPQPLFRRHSPDHSQQQQQSHQRRDSQDRPDGLPPKPPTRLGIKHMDLLYLNQNNSLTCRMCLTRRTPDTGQLRGPGRSAEKETDMDTDKERGNERQAGSRSVKKFSGNASWDELVSHCYSEHPTACAELEKLTPSQIEERKQRMGSRVAR